LELVLQVRSGRGIFREKDEAGGVLVDAVHHERSALAVRTETFLELIVDGRHATIAFERHGEQAGRLVDDDQTVVLEDDIEIADGAGPGTSARGAGTIGPDPYAVAGPEQSCGVRQCGFRSVQIHLAPFERRRRLASRAETNLRGKVLVEPGACLLIGY